MQTTQQVRAYPVPELARQGFLAASFGIAHAAKVRTLLSQWMTSLSERGEHPQWRFFLLSNGGFYVAPIQMTPLSSLYRGQTFDGRISSDAAGIIATLLTLIQLSKESHGHELVVALDRLLEFAHHHDDWDSIQHAIT